MTKKIKGMIGLEIHGYLETKEKLFCTCKNHHDMKQIKPNTNICPICTGQPGAKPMLPNKSAIDKLLQIALILNCKPNLTPKSLIFQRKHYSWPDMPTGYQKTISGAYSIPVAENGKFEGIRITEVHLEEDPAAWNPETGTVDYNRAGVPLVEIVTEPDFKSSKQVEKWLRKLVLSLSYIKALNKDAGIKADVNVNIKGLSKRTEIKNVNSISEIVLAIDSEIQRHIKEKPKTLETRRWNSSDNKTELMRKKEEQADYRFIPDPDLPIIKINKSRIRQIQKTIPESPQDKLNKIIKKHNIDKKNANILIQNIDIAELFEKVVKDVDAKTALPWITVELFSVLNYNKKLPINAAMIYLSIFRCLFSICEPIRVKLAIVANAKIIGVLSFRYNGKKKLRINERRIINKGVIRRIGSISERSSLFRAYIIRKFAQIEIMTIEAKSIRLTDENAFGLMPPKK